MFKIKGATSRPLLCFSNVKTCPCSIEFKGPFFVIQGCIKLFLSSTAMDGKSGRKLKLENVWPNFSSCNAVPRIITEKNCNVLFQKISLSPSPSTEGNGNSEGREGPRESNFQGGGDLLPKFGSNYGKALGTLTRARTDFWIQNLRLFQT